MQIINDRHAEPVTLDTPRDGGNLVVAVQVGRWVGPWAVPSRRRTAAVSRAVEACRALNARDDVTEAVVFRGVLRPPGEGAGLLARAGLRAARHDIVVLIRTEAVDDIDAVRTDPHFRTLATELGADAYVVAADNAARIADVDHRRDDWFLFNFFYCADAETVYDVWEYTAGWFQRHTALPNSTLLRPLRGERTDYRIVNHASWPHLRTFLPALLFHPGFRRFVLANFRLNGVAAQPIIYRVAR